MVINKKKKARSLPKGAEKRSTFHNVCAFLDKNGERQYSLGEIHDRMNEEGKPAHSRQHIKENLLATFGDKSTTIE